MSANARDMHAVDGKVIIVTGSGRGVGRGMALHLGRGGARIVVAEWKPHLCAEVCAELTDLGIENLGVACDIQEKDQIDAMVAQTVERFGRVDGLVNNAQTFRPLSPIAEVSERDVDVFYDSGVKGTLWAMQAVYPHMRSQGWGRIVNFASSMGITGGSGFAAYNASKEAIRALTRTAAGDFDAQGHLNNASTVRLFNDLRMAYGRDEVGDVWVDMLRRDGLVVAARELHVLYESEGLPDEEFVGAMRYVRREGKASVLEQRLVERATGRAVARAWVGQLR